MSSTYSHCLGHFSSILEFYFLLGTTGTTCSKSARSIYVTIDSLLLLCLSLLLLSISVNCLLLNVMTLYPFEVIESGCMLAKNRLSSAQFCCG